MSRREILFVTEGVRRRRWRPRMTQVTFRIDDWLLKAVREVAKRTHMGVAWTFRNVCEEGLRDTGWIEELGTFSGLLDPVKSIRIVETPDEVGPRGGRPRVPRRLVVQAIALREKQVPWARIADEIGVAPSTIRGAVRRFVRENPRLFAEERGVEGENTGVLAKDRGRRT